MTQQNNQSKGNNGKVEKVMTNEFDVEIKKIEADKEVEIAKINANNELEVQKLKQAVETLDLEIKKHLEDMKDRRLARAEELKSSERKTKIVVDGAKVVGIFGAIATMVIFGGNNGNSTSSEF